MDEASPLETRALACPGCRGSLSLHAAQRELTCAGCDRVYPLREGVAIVLLAEASHRKPADFR